MVIHKISKNSYLNNISLIIEIKKYYNKVSVISKNNELLTIERIIYLIWANIIQVNKLILCIKNMFYLM